MLLPGLALGPGLELMHGVATGIGIVVMGDLGQLGLMQPAIVGVLLGPCLKFGVWPGGGAAAGGINHGNNLQESVNQA